MRLRRRGWILLGLLAGLLLAAWWINRQLQPERLSAWALQAAGSALDLELQFSGKPDYALRPEPRLRLPGFKAFAPGEKQPLLSADLLEISLPWSTLTDSDAPLAITRLELQAPVLDVEALRRWQASLPPEPIELPRLDSGLHIARGRVIGKDWRVTDLELTLPRFARNSAAQLTASGMLDAGEQSLGFELALAVEKIAVQTPFTLKASLSWPYQGKVLPINLQLDGDFIAEDSGTRVVAQRLDFDGSEPLPDFHGKGQFGWGETLQLQLRGDLPAWPSAWPALPAPLSASSAPLQLDLGYSGPSDLGGELQAKAQRDQARVEARLRWPLLKTWWDAGDYTRLPPLQLRAEIPQLEFEGARIEGLQVELDDAQESPKP